MDGLTRFHYDVIELARPAECKFDLFSPDAFLTIRDRVGCEQHIYELVLRDGILDHSSLRVSANRDVSKSRHIRKVMFHWPLLWRARQLVVKCYARLTVTLLRTLATFTLFLLAASAANAQTGWSGEITNLSLPNEQATDLQLEMDGVGNAFAVWTTKGSTSDFVKASRLPAGRSHWSEPVTFSVPGEAPGIAEHLDLAISAEGDAVAVWTRRAPVDTKGVIHFMVYDATADSWQPGTVPGAVNASHPSVVLREGVHTFTWFETALKSAFRTATGWSSVTTIAEAPAFPTRSDNRLVIDGAGNITVAWAGPNHEFLAAQSQSGSQTWGPARPIAYVIGSPHARLELAADDTTGNVAAIWGTFSLNDWVLGSARFVRTANRWVRTLNSFGLSEPYGRIAAGANTEIAIWLTPGPSAPNHDGYGARAVRCDYRTSSCSAWRGEPEVSADVAIDGAGNALALWQRDAGGQWIAQARRYTAATDSWSAATVLGSMGETPSSPNGQRFKVAMHASGHAVVGWLFESTNESSLRVTEWIGLPAAPSITTIIPANEALTVEFNAPPTTDAAFQATDYEYSLDNGTTWRQRTPASAASPLVIGSLINGTAYTVRIRAINRAGAGAASAPASATVGAILLAPIDFRVASNVGNTVTLAWTVRPESVPPTAFAIEGGLTPGSVLASVTMGSATRTFTFTAPTGAFYARVHAVSDTTRSSPSNEIRLFVNVPPSAPENLTGQAVGSLLNLSWRNSIAGGAATAITLDVTGTVSMSVPLSGTAESFAYHGVPPGTYTFSVRAANRSGVSGSSNSVTLTFPGACPAPGAPVGLTADYTNGAVILNWTAAPGGTLATSFRIEVGSDAGLANIAVVTTGSAATTFSATAPRGSYLARVRALNSCGISSPSNELLVLVGP
jgi:hypothetical protein